MPRKPKVKQKQELSETQEKSSVKKPPVTSNAKTKTKSVSKKNSKENSKNGMDRKRPAIEIVHEANEGNINDGNRPFINPSMKKAKQKTSKSKKQPGSNTVIKNINKSTLLFKNETLEDVQEEMIVSESENDWEEVDERQEITENQEKSNREKAIAMSTLKNKSKSVSKKNSKENPRNVTLDRKRSLIGNIKEENKGKVKKICKVATNRRTKEKASQNENGKKSSAELVITECINEILEDDINNKPVNITGAEEANGSESESYNDWEEVDVIERQEVTENQGKSNQEKVIASSTSKSKSESVSKKKSNENPRNVTSDGEKKRSLIRTIKKGKVRKVQKMCKVATSKRSKESASLNEKEEKSSAELVTECINELLENDIKNKKQVNTTGTEEANVSESKSQNDWEEVDVQEKQEVTENEGKSNQEKIRTSSISKSKSKSVSKRKSNENPRNVTLDGKRKRSLIRTIKEKNERKVQKICKVATRRRTKESASQNETGEKSITEVVTECINDLLEDDMKNKKQVTECKNELLEDDMKIKKQVNTTGAEEANVSESESENDWEEVEDLPVRNEGPSQTSSKSVEIIIQSPSMKNKGGKQFDWEAYFKTQVNRFKKNLHINIHKVHLLCLLGHGIHLNDVCNDPTLQAQMFSFFQSEMTSWGPNILDKQLLEKMLKWFHSIFSYDSNGEENKIECWKDKLSNCLLSQQALSKVDLVLLFMISLRLLKLDVRLVLSLQPLSFKQDTKQDSKMSSLKQKNKSAKVDADCRVINKNEESGPSHNKKVIKELDVKEKVDLEKSNITGQSHKTNKKSAVKSKSSRKSIAAKVEACDSEYELETKQEINRIKRKCRFNKKPLVDQEESSDDEALEMETKVKKLKKEATLHVSSDSDFQPESDIPLFSLKKKTGIKKVSSAAVNEVEIIYSTIPVKGLDHWVEVYIPVKEKWICIDCINKIIDSPNIIEKSATQPISYVVAVDNAGSIKDVTQRYSCKWLTHTRKLRIDETWWKETLIPFKSTETERDSKENEDFSAHWLALPLPASISEFKNHPLYVLKRHLLKFEAIYPPTAAVLGFIRNEPVYSRDCVHTLSSRETWIKEARVVRIGEEPYKIVKARPKLNKSKETEKNPLLHVFGFWQTEEYIPPIAVDGKVPRNEYGNVELFKPCMLPVGTVHLPIPGLGRVARKLNIDCAPAMVGWDFCSYTPRPVMDGWVVCTEVKDVLIAAWEQDQEEIKKKEKEKREKRIYGNWKKLIRSLLIREKLKKKYNLKSADDIAEGPEVKADDFEKSWPRNINSSSTDKQSQDSSCLFPFEEL